MGNFRRIAVLWFAVLMAACTGSIGDGPPPSPPLPSDPLVTVSEDEFFLDDNETTGVCVWYYRWSGSTEGWVLGAFDDQTEVRMNPDPEETFCSLAATIGPARFPLPDLPAGW